uniref:Uncharacterized protein n=1 Tax=viral metagenome TaxID=1070528 RepID=A0A6H1ZXJ7_9ZZZZ
MSINIFIRIITFVIENMSGDLRKAIIAAILNWERIAEETPNPIDNVIVMFLKAILQIELIDTK